MGAADLQRSSGDLAAAEKNYGRAAELEPFNYNAQYWHAVTLQELGQFSRSITAYLRALQLRPDSFESNAGVAAAYLQAGEPREALPFAQRAIELKNDDYAARTTLGAIYSALGDNEAAIVEFQQAAELGELSPKLLLNLAENYGKTKRFDEMVNTLDEVIRREPTAAAYERMGSGLFRLSRFDEALDAFQKATELDNTYFPAFNGVGVCLLQRWLASGQTDRLARDEGLRALRRSLQIKRDQPKVLELVGRHKN
jgi:tetratricopeptide (TPR) repeat protein